MIDMDAKTRQDNERVGRYVKRLFDADFYLSTCGEVKERGYDPLEHYLEFGWREGRNPYAGFDTTFYLADNPDVRDSGECPLIHYAREGAAQQRQPSPSPSAQMIIKAQKHFDRNYYLATYQDVKASGIDPFMHYLFTGWREGRNPSATFDTYYYLETNPAARAADECPLLHYTREGAAARRLTRSPLAIAQSLVHQATSVRDQAASWTQISTEAPCRSAALAKIVRKMIGENGHNLVISFSHDDYAQIFGGLQICISDEQTRFTAAGWQYLHISPAHPLPLLADSARSDFEIFLRLNGQKIGIVTFEDLLKAIAPLRRIKCRKHLVVHHLLGFDPELITRCVETICPDETIVWVHDYFTLCPNYMLLRNNVAFCGAPPVDSPSCGICVHGAERQQHLRRLDDFFTAIKPTVLAPSQAALDIWLRRSGFAYTRAEVASHGNLTDAGPLARPQGKQAQKFPLRIAFLGQRAYYKGWNVFEALVARYGDDPRYQFFQFATTRPPETPNIHFVEMKVDSSVRHAMSDMVAANQIDVALIWSVWPETFCFTAHEAVAGGAYVITHRDAGNVPVAICRPDLGFGHVLESQDELFKLFESGDIAKLVQPRRPMNFKIQAATFNYLTRQAVHG
jgi:hypothetical protein